MHGGVVTTPVAFVTGAAGGIGRATVAALRAARYRVYATDVALAAVPCGAGGDFASASLDVTDERQVQAAVEDCLATMARIDHVIHLAGRAGRGPLGEVSVEDWRSILDVNLTSGFLIAKATHRALAASRGSMVLMASTNALNGGSALSGPAYAVAKAGTINLTRYLAKEWAPERIRVNCLAPGPIDTQMVTGRFSAETLGELRRTVPLGRIGAPEEVAHAVMYLISERAGFVTGTVMNVSGGLVLD